MCSKIHARGKTPLGCVQKEGRLDVSNADSAWGSTALFAREDNAVLFFLKSVSLCAVGLESKWIKPVSVPKPTRLNSHLVEETGPTSPIAGGLRSTTAWPGGLSSRCPRCVEHSLPVSPPMTNPATKKRQTPGVTKGWCLVPK